MFMRYTCRSESTNIFGTNDVICRVIWCHLSFLTYHFSIFDDVGGGGGWTALTMWPANDCLQERSAHAWCRLTDMFGCKWYSAHAKMKPCFFPPWDRSCVKMADCFASQRDFDEKTNSVIACVLQISVLQINYFCAPHWNIRIFFDYQVQ